MNKASNSNDDYEMLDDYSEILDRNWSKVVRGKYSHRYPKDRQPVARITSSDGVKYVQMRWFEAQALITPDHKLTAKVTSDIPLGEHRVSLLIQVPANLTSEGAIASEDGEPDVAIKTFEAEASITPDNKLILELDSDLLPGEYQVTLIIEEPTNPPPLEATDKINREEENIKHSS